MTPIPDPRTIRRALGVLERLPAEALADLAERLIDRLDAGGPDPDLEEESDLCPAEDVRVPGRAGHEAGDADDAEPDVDEEPDDDGEPDAPPRLPGKTRAERDGIVQVRRRAVMTVLYRAGRPVRAVSMLWVPIG